MTPRKPNLLKVLWYCLVRVVLILLKISRVPSHRPQRRIRARRPQRVPLGSLGFGCLGNDADGGRRTRIALPTHQTPTTVRTTLATVSLVHWHAVVMRLDNLWLFLGNMKVTCHIRHGVIKRPPTRNELVMGLAMANQILAELRAALVDAHGVSDHDGGGLGRVGELATLHPGVLEARDGIDGVEEAQKADPTYGSAEGVTEGGEVLEHLPLLLLLFFRPVKAHLPLCECFPGKPCL